MPIKPTVSQLDANSVGILNAIRDNASAEYYQAVPQAQATTESIRAVGEQILAFQPPHERICQCIGEPHCTRGCD